jgi:hypothetical protein
VLRAGEEGELVGELDDLAEMHDGNAMVDMLDHREIVRDEEVGEAELALQVSQQIDHLRLHRDVERRHRLVADDKARMQCQRAGNADPLALAAGKFVQVAVQRLGAWAA